LIIKAIKERKKTVSKKTNQKKKVNIKLKPGQSFLIEDLDVLIHIQKHYATNIGNQFNDKDKDICHRVILAVNEAINNVYNSTSEEYGEE